MLRNLAEYEWSFCMFTYQAHLTSLFRSWRGSSLIHPFPRPPLLREIPFGLPVDFNRVLGLSLRLKFLVLRLTTDTFNLKTTERR